MRNYGKKRADPQTKIEGTKSFSMGLSQLGHPSVIKPNELAEALNCFYTLNGVVEKRPGSQTIGDIRGSSTKLNVIQDVYELNGINYFLRISDDGIMQKYVWSSNLWVDIAGSPTFSNVKTAIKQSWGLVYIMNAVDPFTTWDGSTFSTKDPLENPSILPIVETVGTGRVTAVKVDNGGTGYAVGNVLSVDGGDGACTLFVKTISGSSVSTVEITNAGTKYSMAKGVATTVAPSGGTGCKVDITGVVGSGNRNEFYRYSWQNNGGQTRCSLGAEATGLPEQMDADTYVKVTLPAAPAGTEKTLIFRGNTANDEVYLASVPANTLVYNDKDFDQADISYKIPAANTTSGMHFKDGIVDVYEDTIIGVTEEMGNHCLVFSAGGEKMDSFGRADGSGYFYYKKDDGYKITGVHEFQESLYVFKTNKIGSFKFTPEGAMISTISLASGAVSQESIHAAGNDLRYWSDQGAMSVGNEPNLAGVRTKVLSARADKVVTNINPAELEKISSVFYKSHSLWALPQGTTGTGNTTVLSYNEKFAAWSEWFGLKPAQFCKVVDPDNNERLFFSKSNSANVVEGWTGRSDEGNPIVWRASTKQFDAGVSYKHKTYNRVYFVFGNVTGGNTRVVLTENGFKKQQPLAMYASNLGEQGFGVDEWGTMEFGNSSGDIDENASGINIRFTDVGYKDLFSLQATFSNDGITDTLQLMGMFIEYSDSSLPLPSNLELTPIYE